MNFFISQKVCISSINSFHAQISRIISWPGANHNRWIMVWLRPWFAHSQKVILKMCAWNEFTKEIQTPRDVNNWAREGCEVWCVKRKNCHSECHSLVGRLCRSRKYPYSPNRRFFVLHPPCPQEIPVYLHSLLPKFLLLDPLPPRNFQWPSKGWVWIFSGTTH